MPGAGEYLPDASEGTSRVEDLPKPKITERGRDFCGRRRLRTPEAERQGRVFKLNGLKTGEPISPKRICRLVAKIGKSAGVVANKADGKYAAAHDLAGASAPAGQGASCRPC